MSSSRGEEFSSYHLIVGDDKMKMYDIHLCKNDSMHLTTYILPFRPTDFIESQYLGALKLPLGALKFQKTDPTPFFCILGVHLEQATN